MNIKNKIAIVTGASSGIGLATAKLLTEKGAKVALVARSKDKLEKISKELPGSYVVVADLSDEKQARNMARKAIKHYGRIDILINNAGVGYDAFLEKTDTKKFRELLELELLTPVAIMQEVIPVMRKNGGGAIVNISSGTALMALPNMGAYSSTKRALVGVSLTAREELKKDNIQVSVIYPYITLTNFDPDFYKMDFSNLPSPPDTPEHVAEKILEAINGGKAEVYAHDWLAQRS